MIAIHQVFRDTLGHAPTVIGAVAVGDTHRVALVANFYVNVLSLLRVHHQGEDELMFPLLRDRCGGQLALVDRVASQHPEAHNLLAVADGSLRQWTAANGGRAQQCATALEALGGHLESHLDDEERVLLPLCAQHLSAPEWGALPRHAMAGFTGDKLWLILGLVAERMTPTQRGDMFAHMPPPVVDMWANGGETAFADLMVELGPPLGPVARESD